MIVSGFKLLITFRVYVAGVFLMELKSSSFNLIVLVNLFFCFSVGAFAQTNQAVLTPVINFLLDEPEFSCEFSIEPLSPTVGSNIENGDRVTAQISYRLTNVPSEFEVSFSSFLFAEPNENGSQSGLILNSNESLVIKDLGSNDVDLSGQIEVGATINFQTDTLFENLELRAIFRRAVTEEDFSFFEIGTIVTTNTSVPSCNEEVTSIVNYFLPNSSTIAMPRS